MATKKKQDLIKVVNASGFAFQLAVEQKVKATFGKHLWTVLAHEHPWRDLETGDQGFIDLILQNGTQRLVLECKRSLDATWIFLIPEGNSKATQRINFQWTDTRAGLDPMAGWSDYDFKPCSVEAEFCNVRGTGESAISLLERLCNKLLTSLERLADEEMKINMEHKRSPMSYVAAIVTNADLQVCKFNPALVSLRDGKILSRRAKFEGVKFMRFRKTLTPVLPGGGMPKDIESANRIRERTVLVINASALTDFLCNFKPRDLDPYREDLLPWDAARQQRK